MDRRCIAQAQAECIISYGINPIPVGEVAAVAAVGLKNAAEQQAHHDRLDDITLDNLISRLIGDAALISKHRPCCDRQYADPSHSVVLMLHIFDQFTQ